MTVHGNQIEGQKLFADKLLEAVQNYPGKTARELTFLLNGCRKHQSQVNAEAHILMQRGLLTRIKNFDGVYAYYPTDNHRPSGMQGNVYSFRPPSKGSE